MRHIICLALVLLYDSKLFIMVTCATNFSEFYLSKALKLLVDTGYFLAEKISTIEVYKHIL